MMKKILASALAAASLGAAAPAMAATCDRACLEGVADRVLLSMTMHDAGAMPLAREYKATQNNVPQAVSMMSLWRTATGIDSKFVVVDDKAGQIFLVATVEEGPTKSLTFGRIGVDAAAGSTRLRSTSIVRAAMPGFSMAFGHPT